MKTPNNQYQQVLWYLYNFKKPFSLSQVINHSMFYKFQTRLGEIEKEHGFIAKRYKKNFINVFGRSSICLLYEALDFKMIKKLYKLYE